MTSSAEKAHIVFQTIGYPIGSGSQAPSAETLEGLTNFAFKNRVGLLFLEECLRHGVELGPAATELHKSLIHRRAETDRVVVKLAGRLDEVAFGEWSLFKSIKPFASTPNDTDWFPLEPSRHEALCRHLQQSGDFKLLEVAPRQTTLVEAGSEGVTDTTKRGGMYYIDCYVAPSTDYFLYLDQRRLVNDLTTTKILGYDIPILEPYAELTAIMFHNVFPERSYSIESYYLIKMYLEMIRTAGKTDDFIRICRDQKMEYAAAANLGVTAVIDELEFGIHDSHIADILRSLGRPDYRVPGFNGTGKYPYEFPNSVFWLTFFLKLRDKTSRRSAYLQLLRMLNPIFFADVVKIIYRRSIRGGVYEQN